MLSFIGDLGFVQDVLLTFEIVTKSRGEATHQESGRCHGAKVVIPGVCKAARNL